MKQSEKSMREAERGKRNVGKMITMSRKMGIVFEIFHLIDQDSSINIPHIEEKIKPVPIPRCHKSSPILSRP